MLSYDEAIGRVTAPGERFETDEVDIRGVDYTIFRNAPAVAARDLRDDPPAGRRRLPRLRGRAAGRFADVVAEVDALGAALVERYGVQQGRPGRHRHAQLPRVGRRASRPSRRSAPSPCRSTPGGPTDELDYALEDCGADGAHRRRRAGRAQPPTRARGWASDRSACALPEAIAGDGVDRWEDVVVAGAAHARRRRSTRTTTPRSSTRRARPAVRRARCRPTAPCVQALHGVRVPRPRSTALRQPEEAPTRRDAAGVHPHRAAVPRDRRACR